MWDIRRPYVPELIFGGHKDVVTGFQWIDTPVASPVMGTSGEPDSISMLLTPSAQHMLFLEFNVFAFPIRRCVTCSACEDNPDPCALITCTLDVSLPPPPPLPRTHTQTRSHLSTSSVCQRTVSSRSTLWTALHIRTPSCRPLRWLSVQHRSRGSRIQWTVR